MGRPGYSTTASDEQDVHTKRSRLLHDVERAEQYEPSFKVQQELEHEVPRGSRHISTRLEGHSLPKPRYTSASRPSTEQPRDEFGDQSLSSLESRRLVLGAVRLLKLYPAVRLEHPISFDLVTHNLAFAPPYEALSYAWGPKTDKHYRLLVDSCSGLVTIVRQNIL